MEDKVAVVKQLESRFDAILGPEPEGGVAKSLLRSAAWSLVWDYRDDTSRDQAIKCLLVAAKAIARSTKEEGRV